ncbi:MAG TPA: hypothetical protein VL485_04120, partial [Ktedonobacteraceae bacterium]|nr:hypothetical protein [Ktedonobacteraceae bacterium]
MSTESSTTKDSLSTPQPTLPSLEAELSIGEVGAQNLLKRTPHSYLFNQIYGFWFFISWFLLTVIITHEVSTAQYGFFAVALTAYNTILYIVAFGLEDATTTYIPRIFAEHGQGAAAHLIRRLLGIRLLVLLVSVAVIIFGMPVIASIFALLPFPEGKDIANTLRSPALLA